MGALLAGLATGILSGFGVGGGTLLLIYMTTFAGVPQNLAQGINLLYFLPTAAAALPAHLKNGFVEKSLLLPAILSGLLTAALAAWMATHPDYRICGPAIDRYLNDPDNTPPEELATGVLFPVEKVTK